MIQLDFVLAQDFHLVTQSYSLYDENTLNMLFEYQITMLFE